jgi:general secretion pathway protein G
MESGSIGRLTYAHNNKSANRVQGFSLLEMMMVVTVILIVASISTPIYMTCVVRAREAVLRDHLFTMRSLIDRFTLDNGRAPARLEELAEKGYLGRLPTDPFTGSNETWQAETEDASPSPQDSSPEIVDVHSGSNLVSLEGTPYSTWPAGADPCLVGSAISPAPFSGANHLYY